jgi:Wiskott-Aldrich syndrome protein
MAELTSIAASDESDRYRVVLSELPPGTYKIYATASARVYHAHFGGSQHDWTYTRLKGVLSFGKDRSARGSLDSSIGTASVDADGFWFRLVDETSGKVVWMIKVPKALNYQVDRPFFHIFPGRSRMFGFRFEDDDEAKMLSKEVIDRLGPTGVNTRITKKSKSLPAQAAQLSTSMISTPKAFVHVSHVGINEKGVVEASEGLDPVWATLVGELKGRSATDAIIQNNLECVEGFLEGAKVSKKSGTQPARSRAKRAMK